MGRYINPFTDWGFKRLFGQEFSKDLLINFLNDLFEGEFQIKDVTFKDKEQLGETNDLRGCIFDIYCVTDDDKHFIVEMQNRWVPFFVNRSIYYASKAFVAQRKKFDEAGVRTAVLYQFVPVYVVCIMNFMPREHEVTKFRTDVALREKSSDSMFSDKLRFIYLSLPFFDKSEEECETGFEKLISVLKYMEMDEVFKNLPLAEQKKMLDHLAKLADVRFLSSEEREKYDESIKAADDYYGVLMSYYMNSIDEGVAKGEARGSHHKSLEIAKKMMAKGMDENTIMEITGLTQEEIRKLIS